MKQTAFDFSERVTVGVKVDPNVPVDLCSLILDKFKTNIYEDLHSIFDFATIKTWVRGKPPNVPVGQEFLITLILSHHAKRRLLLFDKSSTCAHCGIEGNVYVESKYHTDPKQNKILHLYAVQNNKMIRMTVDHILPTCIGGANSRHNFQTLCVDCNTIKGNMMQKDEINKVLKNISIYAKPWCDINYIKQLLDIKLLSYEVIGEDQIKLQQLFNKYQPRIQHAATNATNHRNMSNLKTELDMLVTTNRRLVRILSV